MPQSISLVDAAAYLISKAHEAGLQEDLGKIKLFKMMFMASWWAVDAHDRSIHDGPWYRIDMGPALRTGDWEILEGSLRQKYGISATRKRMWHGYPQFFFSPPTRKPETPSDGDVRTPLDAAYSEIISMTAIGAGHLTYNTEPMRWLVAEERAKWGASTQYREFNLRDPARTKFLSLARSYVEGHIEIDAIAREMGEPWSLHDVVVYLDTFRFSRPIDKLSLSPHRRSQILASLARTLQGPHTARQQTSDEMAVASSRIEEQYITPDSISE